VFLKNLYLRNFRNYIEAEVHFSERINLLYGDNAQGKTNMLEAIYLVATGRSFRTESLPELIRAGESFFFIEAEIVRDGVPQRVQISFDGTNKKVQLDATTYSSFNPLLGILPSVLYTPYDIELISGSPAERRRFLNLHLAQSDPLYVHHLTRFWKAMKQRNCLLRTKISESVDCWEIEMAQSAAYIEKARQEMVMELNPLLKKQGQKLTQKEEIHELHLQLSASKAYLEQLKKNRNREMELGFTLTGPHRDDLSILIDQKLARSFASEGQKKTAIAALKLAEWERLTHRIGDRALMGFDDLGQHLDDTRQKLLRSSLNELGQVFITMPHLPKEEGHLIHIEKGQAQIRLACK
jgi:DNA replication and repair protein RecF